MQESTDYLKENDRATKVDRVERRNQLWDIINVNKDW